MTTEIFMVCEDSLVHVAVPPGDYVIGRDPDSDIHINDPSVSSRHARLVVESETVCIQDLDSENGTFIDGEPAVALTNLYDGQTAVLGSVSLRVRQSTDPRSLGEGPRYVRGGMVAFGGMGAIHEARQAAMGRKVAMKVMLHSWNAASVKRFLDEARITGMLEHPNIVPVHELGLDEEEQFFYTMKFVRGSTLAEVIAGLALDGKESAKKFPLQVLLTIFQKVCDAVAFAHSRGVWHRDLKPENIMIGDFGEVLVMDWGLAKESGFASPDPVSPGEDSPAAPESSSASAPMRTMEGMVLGTPAYMAPEQARGETSAVDHRSDIYSLGAILHEILYLQPPVRGKSRERILEKVAAGVRELPEKSPARHLPAQRVPASLEAVCRKAMAADRDGRYREVTELQADIAAYQSGFATSAESAGFGKHFLLFVKRHRSVSIAVAAGLAALFASSVLFTVNIVRQRNVAQAALRDAQAARAAEQERAREALANDLKAKEMEGKASVADRKAEQADNGRQAALAEAEEVKLTAGQKLQETKSRLAQDFSRMARDAVAQGRPALAGQLFRTAAEYVPDNPNYLAQHGLLLLALGEYKGAVARFKRALQIDPDVEVREELEKAQELQKAEREGNISAEHIGGLERLLMARGHAPYVRVVDSRTADAAARAGAQLQLEGEELIRIQLGDLVAQPGWRDERIKKLDDGSFRLDLRGLGVQFPPDLAFTGIAELDLEGTKVDDISALRGLSLRSLNLAGTRVSDLSPLQNMPELEALWCSAPVVDLSPLRDAPLKFLDISRSGVEDLEPLRGAQLETLRLSGCKIATLEPVAAQPLKELDADVAGPCDLAPIGKMSGLVKLRLPPRSGMIDAGAMPRLAEILIPDLRGDSAMSGDEYRALCASRTKFWNLYGKGLEGIGLKDFGPDRLLVRQNTDSFDLDLRGTGITNLAPLAKVPVYRLFLDTDTAPVDVGVLASHPTLQHLSLEGAWVPSVEKLASNRKLKSLVLSRDIKDTALLARHPSLQRLGYKLGADGLSPSGTADGFFGPRVSKRDEGPVPQGEPKFFFGFDRAADGTAGWRLDDGSRHPPIALWMADPQAEGGAGGGYLTFYERKGNGVPSYFVASPSVGRNQRDLIGGLIEFRLRVGRELNQSQKAAVVIVGVDRILHHTSDVRPIGEWTTVCVPLTAAGRWSIGGANGLPAGETDLREALSKLREIRIQAEFSGEDLDERTDLDDVRFWEPGPGAARRAQLQNTQL